MTDIEIIKGFLINDEKVIADFYMEFKSKFCSFFRTRFAKDEYSDISESDALRICIKDAITDGKGMGFGLYSTSLLARDIGLSFEVRSGNHTMKVQDGKELIVESDFWQGTIVYLQLITNKEINPAEVVANRTNVASQYNETFLNDNELEDLW
ncbi:MAG: hypothetical protein IJ383_05920 [Bacteroidales bacterium]|nr:hypothetical protein [Bacteroidales bacterium]